MRSLLWSTLQRATAALLPPWGLVGVQGART